MIIFYSFLIFLSWLLILSQFSFYSVSIFSQVCSTSANYCFTTQITSLSKDNFSHKSPSSFKNSQWSPKTKSNPCTNEYGGYSISSEPALGIIAFAMLDVWLSALLWYKKKAADICILNFFEGGDLKLFTLNFGTSTIVMHRRFVHINKSYKKIFHVLIYGVNI